MDGLEGMGGIEDGHRRWEGIQRGDGDKYVLGMYETQRKQLQSNEQETRA